MRARLDAAVNQWHNNGHLLIVVIDHDHCRPQVDHCPRADGCEAKRCLVAEELDLLGWEAWSCGPGEGETYAYPSAYPIRIEYGWAALGADDTEFWFRPAGTGAAIDGQEQP